VTAPRAEYESRLHAWRGRIASLENTHLTISNGRLTIAATGAVLMWLAFIRAVISPWWPIVAGLAFAVLAVIHARVLMRAERARRAEHWYSRGLARLAGDWVGRARDGARFADDHPYARDLDLFGRGSLFELLNTAKTETGEETLAAWLKTGATTAEIASRQAAIQELREKMTFREELAVLAAESAVSRTSSMASWAQSAPAGLTATHAAVFAATAAMIAAVIFLALTERIGARFLLLAFIGGSIVASIWRRQVRRVLARVGSADHDLAVLSDVLARIEAERFSAPRLTAIQSALAAGGVPPSRRIAELRRLVSWLDSTRNQIFAPFALAILLPHQLAVAIDRWHVAHGRSILGWLQAIGELEALSALGTYAFEHPHDVFPSLMDEGPVFDASALGHPLMIEETAVPNDIALGGDAAHVLIVSGSNMSGKSTLLRSVGVNVVLALAGSPVRARRLRLSPLVIGATLKVEDSLQEGRSRFYSEILRIKAIVDATRAHPVLFLLDEILHGTNSHDRRIGAQAIVSALVGLGAIGIVTTHDLALTELPAKLGPQAINVHFEDRLEDGKMVFDYRIRPGVVEHSNALALMRAIGLDV
jgi:MutS domain V